MTSMAEEVKNFQNEIVAILKQFPILLNKSQLPIVKEEKTKALESSCIKLEESLGRKFTPQQVKRKIQNMKTEVKMKTELNAAGIQQIKLKEWEEEFLQLLDGENNLDVTRITDPLLESGSNNVIESDDHQMDSNVKVKEEPSGTSAQVKSESGGFETVFVSSHFEKKCPSDSETDSNETCNKIKIKEEPCWSESTSQEVKQETELPSTDAGMKEPASHTEVITGDVGAEEASRFQTESSKDTASCIFSNKIAKGNAWEDIDNGKTSYIGQTQIHEESASTIKQHNGKKKFARLSNFTKHKSTHGSKRCHTCDICQRNFSRSSTLKEHKFIHEGIRPHVCDICNKAFTQLSQLKEHKLIHEGIRPHTCEICKKTFTHASTIRKHKLIHKGIKSHTCEICNRSFFHASNLKKHKLVHDGIKPYTCEICNKSFANVLYFKKHQITHVRQNLTNVESVLKDLLKK